ncbi:MAG: hypothetical protein QOI12_2026 [Alphaproteobacteria bacterium]|jgi:hypothetical protein|nr:hypothetical protein [Alphaproteobacteria bacterium]
MTKITTSLPALLLALCLQATPAHAQLPRTFVSANGSDQNTCGRLTPCRTLAAAYAKTNAGGEINMLDPAGYGTLIITHSISIVNDGVGSAGILVGSGEVGITIDAGPDDEINLRGLIIEGGGHGASGIKFNSGKSLTIQNCVVRGMVFSGIAFVPTGTSTLSVSDCLAAHTDGHGIFVGGQGTGTAVATFNRVESSNNGINGFSISSAGTSGSIDATATNIVAASNGADGVIAFGYGPGKIGLTVVDSVFAYNEVGIRASTRSSVRVGRTTVTGNDSGWNVDAGGVIETYGNNFVHGNAADEDPMTPINPK